MKNKDSRIRPKHFLLVLIGLCLILIIVSTVSSTVNNGVRNVINTVLMPMQRGLNQVGGFLSGEIESVAELKRVQDENTALQEEVEFLRAENTQYQLQLAELEQYRELLDMKEQYPDYDTVGAHVIGNNSGNWNKTVLIDRGSNDGIQVNMNVIAQGGLAGIVTSVTLNSATVRMIADDGCNVGAMSVLSKDSCIVTGNLELYEEGKLRLEKIDKDADIQDDYKIVTGNTSSLYLPGILIGYAQELQIDANHLTKSGYLVPVVDFNHLDAVLVITTLKETGE